MNVSIIIVTYNTLKMTDECICSVINMTHGIEYEIILVDNASSDGSKDFFISDNRLVYVYSNENLGFGRANNLGAKYSSGKYLFLLNSDTILQNNAVKIFYDYMESAALNVACCGCMLRNLKGEYIHSFGDLHTFGNSMYEWVVFPILNKLGLQKELHKYFKPWVRDYPIEVGYVTGADVFLRRNVYEENGLFDPDFFMYYEDSDMGRRWHDAGYKNMIIVGPNIVHLVGASNKKKAFNRNVMVMKSMFLYFEKGRPFLEARAFEIMFKIIYVLSFIIKLPVQKGKFIDKMKYVKKIFKL